MSTILHFMTAGGLLILSARASGQSQADQNAIETLLLVHTQKWNVHEVDAWSHILHEDADWVHWGGGYWRGKQQIRDGHKEIHRTHYKATRMSAQRIEDLHRTLPASADAAPIPLRRTGLVVLLRDCLTHTRVQQSQLLLQTFFAFAGRDRQQVFERRTQTARHLRRSGAGDADLIERQVNIVLPRHGRRHEPYFAGLVAILSIGEGTGRMRFCIVLLGLNASGASALCAYAPRWTSSSQIWRLHLPGCSRPRRTSSLRWFQKSSDLPSSSPMLHVHDVCRPCGISESAFD